MTGSVSTPRTDRVAERRRAVALARRYREFERLSITQIADRARSLAGDGQGELYDPTGANARAHEARYVGVCRGCGSYTQPRNGKDDAYAYCKRCHPGAIRRRWTRELVIPAMREWRARYGRLPSSYDWSRTHAQRRGNEALERLMSGEWPAAGVVSRLFGTWTAARAAEAWGEDRKGLGSSGAEPVGLIGHTGDLCAQSPGIARKIRAPEEASGLT